MAGLVTDYLWHYELQPTRFFKTSNGLVSERRPWPYNRGNTVCCINRAIYNERVYFIDLVQGSKHQKSIARKGFALAISLEGLPAPPTVAGFVTAKQSSPPS